MMELKNNTEMKLDALADYLGVEFAVRDNGAIYIKDDEARGLLSEADIERVAEELFDNKKFREEFDKRYKLLADICQIRIAKEIGFAAEDKAKLYAISEIMTANYREMAKEMCDDAEVIKLKKGGKNGE